LIAMPLAAWSLSVPFPASGLATVMVPPLGPPEPPAVLMVTLPSDSDACRSPVVMIDDPVPPD
jgi:hypothetical protein